MKTTLTLAALLLTTACATVPPPLCDREAQEWNKFDTQEDQCAPTWEPEQEKPNGHNPNRKPADPPRDEPDDGGNGDNGGGETPDTGVPDDPDGGDDTGGGNPPVTDKPKSDNSDANGKGGNRHDREDKTNGGTEEAEDKKDD